MSAISNNSKNISLYQVVPAVPEDAAEITNVLQRAFNGAFHLQTEVYNRSLENTVQRRLNHPDKYTLYKCLCEGKIVGTVGMQWKEVEYTQNDTPLAEVLTLGVVPEHRGQNVAEKLLEVAETAAKIRGFAGSYLCHTGGAYRGDTRLEAMDPKARGLHRFYQRVGYQTFSIGGNPEILPTDTSMEIYQTNDNPEGRLLLIYMAKIFNPCPFNLQRTW